MFSFVTFFKTIIKLLFSSSEVIQLISKNESLNLILSFIRKTPFFFIISKILAIKIGSSVNTSSRKIPFKDSLLLPNKLCVSKLQNSILRFFFLIEKSVVVKVQRLF